MMKSYLNNLNIRVWTRQIFFTAFDWNHDPGNLICKHPDVCSTYTKRDNKKKKIEGTFLNYRI